MSILSRHVGRVGFEFDLKQVEPKLARAIAASAKMEGLVSGMKSGLKQIQIAAAINAPKPGFPGYTYPSAGSKRRGRPRLWQQIITVIRPYYERKKILGLVGPRYAAGGANHGHLVEYGHRIHVGPKGSILQRQQKRGWTPELEWNKRLKTLVYKHGAPRRTKLGAKIGESRGRTRAYPFLKSAADANTMQAQAAFVKATEKYIDKVLRQIGNG